MLRYNIVLMPEEVFSNILPHNLVDATKENVDKRNEIFIGTMQAIYELIEKIASKESVKAWNY